MNTTAKTKIKNLFSKNVVDNKKEKECEKNLNFINEVLSNVVENFDVREIDRGRCASDKNEHTMFVRGRYSVIPLFIRISSKGINIGNSIYEKPSDKVVNKIIKFCNEKFIRLTN